MYPPSSARGGLRKLRGDWAPISERSNMTSQIQIPFEGKLNERLLTKQPGP